MGTAVALATECESLRRLFVRLEIKSTWYFYSGNCKLGFGGEGEFLQISRKASSRPLRIRKLHSVFYVFHMFPVKIIGKGGRSVRRSIFLSKSSAAARRL